MGKAKETKDQAENLHQQADMLDERVQITNKSINESSEKSQKDLNLVENAKEKVCLKDFIFPFILKYTKFVGWKSSIPNKFCPIYH